MLLKLVEPFSGDSLFKKDQNCQNVVYKLHTTLLSIPWGQTFVILSSPLVLHP